jgi:hypothetical protein
LPGWQVARKIADDVGGRERRLVEHAVDHRRPPAAFGLFPRSCPKGIRAGSFKAGAQRPLASFLLPIAAKARTDGERSVR